jgi:hypothetical protein
MSHETDELKETIHNLSDEQLIEMVTVAAGDYRQEALDFAKAELNSRGVDWSNIKPEEAQPEESSESVAEEPAAGLPGSACVVCGAQLRLGRIVAEKESTIIFDDNQEERFITARACIRCGNVALIVDYETDVER